MYTHRNHIIYGLDDPAALGRLIATNSSSMLLALHSPLSKWSFLPRFNPTVMLKNNDYEILRIDAVRN